MTFVKNKVYYKKVFMVGVILLIFIIMAALMLGVANISVKQCFAVILSKVPVLNNLVPVEHIDKSVLIIVLKLRLPRILLAAIAGAGLAVAGVSFQGIFKNAMADPYVLGVSSGAALGAALSMIFGIGTNLLGFSMVTLSAFSGALLTILLVYNIARVGGKIPSITFLLTGLAISFFLTSVISLIMTFKREQIEQIVMWTMGSVGKSDWNQLLTVSPIVFFSIVAIFIFSRDLNIMMLGDESARSLGVEVERVKKIILLICSLMVAVIVSVSGVIGFVGLIVPHIIRLLFGSDHRMVIPFSALGGAILLIISDTIARILVPPNEIPVGIVTSIFGVPFFLSLIYQNKKKVFH